MELPLRQLEKHGHEVTFRSASDEHGKPVTLRDMEGHDIIIGQRFNTHRGLETWRRVRTPLSRLVYETDDDVFSIGPENFQAYNLYQRGDIRDAVTHMAEVSDLITVTTDHLAGVLREHTGNENIAVLPNCIPEWILDLPSKPNPRPVVAWQGGASHGVDVGLIVSPVSRFLKRFPGWDLLIGGTDYRPTFKAGNRARFRSWIPVCEKPREYYESIDFDIGLAPLALSEFSKSKCVDSNMRVCTDLGVLKAGDLQPGMKAWHGGWRKIEAVQRSVPRPGLLISTADGYQMRLTPEHRMHVNGNWLQASEIRHGDVMTMESEVTGVLEHIEVPWPPDGRMSRARPNCTAAQQFDPEAYQQAPDVPRISITPRWGRLLGAFAGDGSAGQATALTISCDGQDADWIELLMHDWRAVGLNPTTERITTFDGKILRRRAVRVASAHLLRVFKHLGVTESRDSGAPKRVVCVPEVIWRSPREVIAEFLAGYFEADGCCISAGVAAVSKSENFIRDIQRLLLLFGIQSVVQPREHKSQTQRGIYWHVRMRKSEAKLFEEYIGFRSERKRARLAEVTGKVHPHDHSKPAEWKNTVTGIETCFVDPVDIQVEGSVFALAGFTSHNSNIKVLEYAARGIPSIATDCEVYRSFIVHGYNGFLVKHEHEWLKYLSELASDEGLRLSMGAHARELAEKWTIESNYERWERAYGSLFPSRSVP